MVDREPDGQITESGHAPKCRRGGPTVGRLRSESWPDDGLESLTGSPRVGLSSRVTRACTLLCDGLERIVDVIDEFDSSRSLALRVVENNFLHEYEKTFAISVRSATSIPLSATCESCSRGSTTTIDGSSSAASSLTLWARLRRC